MAAPLGSVDLSGMYRAMGDMLDHPGARRLMDEMREAARGYVWGHEDAGGQRVREAYGREVCADWEFCHMYGIYYAMYMLGMIGSKQPIQDAYRAFRASQDFGTYVL
jgi:hypothetical protein